MKPRRPLETHLLGVVTITFGLLCAGALLAPDAQAASLGARGPSGQMIYPAKGQGMQQAERDRFECHEWAREQSGFDPTQPAHTAQTASGQPAAGPSGGGRGSALAGAAGGAAIAELADKDPGKGAAVGLLGAGLRQQVQQQRQISAQQQQAQQQEAQQRAAQAQRREGYDRGFAACMEARGYVVK